MRTTARPRALSPWTRSKEHRTTVKLMKKELAEGKLQTESQQFKMISTTAKTKEKCLFVFRVLAPLRWRIERRTNSHIGLIGNGVRTASGVGQSGLYTKRYQQPAESLMYLECIWTTHSCRRRSSNRRTSSQQKEWQVSV